MARIDLRSDERGAVYVEFLIAFLPLFLMFLAICQLALIATAEAVVRHAAYSAARTAVVVLEDAPSKFDGTVRGSLSAGRSKGHQGAEAVLSKLGVSKITVTQNSLDKLRPQQGARMLPIKTAAYLPLLPVAPNEGTGQLGTDSIANAIASTTERQLGFALQYTKAATAVTLHDRPENESLAVEPVAAKSPISARVTYLFHCTVPIVRAMLCRGLGSMPEGRLALVHSPDTIQKLLGAEAQFKLLTATATLPNQGADYCPRDSD